MIYKVGVLGATGRMGLEVCALASQHYRVGDDFFELADAVAETTQIAEVETIPVRTLADPDREPVHVWIDFSRPEATLKLLRQTQAPVVVATTGFTPAQLGEIKTLSEKVGILLAPNLSPGMNHIYKMLKGSSLASDKSFQLLASETHHIHKKDSPSGTLKRLVSILEEKGRSDIPTQSARLGEILGQHTLRFVSDTEEVTLTHEVRDRKVFAKGALLAAHRLIQRNEPGVVSMEDVL